MEQNLQRQDAYRKAEKRVRDLKSFYNHLIVFTCVNVIFLMIVLFFNGNLSLFLISVCGWGIGIIGHAMKTFQWNPLYNKDWEERKIQEFLEKED